MKYAHIFHDEETNDFKGSDVIEHQIVLTGRYGKPISELRMRWLEVLYEKVPLLGSTRHIGTQEECGWETEVERHGNSTPTPTL